MKEPLMRTDEDAAETRCVKEAISRTDENRQRGGLAGC